MKIDFKKLRQIEVEYCTSMNMPGNINISNDMSRETLSNMMNLILSYEGGSYSRGPLNVKLAYNTLKDLGIIMDDSKIKPEQLNS